MKTEKNNDLLSGWRLYAFALAVLGALLLWGFTGESTEIELNSSTKSGSVSGGLQVIGEDIFDFSELSMAAGKVRHTFKIKNTGGGDAVVAKIYTSCMCTEATLVMNGEKFGPYGMQGHGGFIPTIGKTVAAGEEADVIVEFDPAAHGPAGTGQVARVVYVETGAAKPLELKFSARVKP